MTGPIADTSRSRPFTFLDLPVEIRLVIYEYAFTASEEPFCKLKLHCSIPSHSITIDDCVSQWTGTRTYPYQTAGVRLTKFLSSCRQIWEEASPIAWRGTEIDLVDQNSIVPMVFFRDVKPEYSKQLRFLTFDWETLRDILDNKADKAYAYIFTRAKQFRLERLHLRVNNSYDAFMGVYQTFVHRWYAMPNVTTMAAEWTMKSRSHVDFVHYTTHMKTNLEPQHRLTVQYAPTDYIYEFPTLIISSRRDNHLDDRLPDDYPYVNRIADNSDDE